MFQGSIISRCSSNVPRRHMAFVILVVFRLGAFFLMEKTPTVERGHYRPQAVSDPRTSLENLCHRTSSATAKYLPDGYDLLLHQLNCAQLTRSIQNWTIPPLQIPGEPNEIEWNNPLLIENRRRMPNSDHATAELHPSLSRLAHKLSLSSRSRTLLKILAVGGSMTKGIELPTGREMELAWPNQFLNLLTNEWNNYSDDNSLLHYNENFTRFQLVNIAVGGADENYWIANMHAIINELPLDIILLESAVNDQCDYNEVEAKALSVSSSSLILLNQLVTLPGAPAVVNVELFRTAGGNLGDAQLHCRGHVRQLNTTANNTNYYYCPQWWLPPDWRMSAREANNVPAISYRDAVWPIHDRPPNELPQYWEGGLSHPNSSTHYMVATMLFFAFIFAHEHAHLVPEYDFAEDAAAMGETGKYSRPPEQTCYIPISDWNFRSFAGAMAARPLVENWNDQNCWQFYEDVPGKYGCICETSASDTIVEESMVFRIGISVGGEGKVLLNRLVSYDHRMASIQVWFGTHENPDVNAFADAPVWTVNSWHSESTSIPVTQVLWLPTTMNAALGLQWPDGLPVRDDRNGKIRTMGEDGPPVVELIMNIEMIRYSSNATSITTITNNGHMDENLTAVHGTDKFKLLSITTC